MATKAACPDRDSLQDMLAGEIDGDDLARLDQHIESCAECQETLDRLSSSAWDDEAKHLVEENFVAQDGNLQELVTTMLQSCRLPDTVDATENLTDNERSISTVFGEDYPDQFGTYQLMAPVGRGGFGEVFMARDEKLDRIVALKILAPALATNPTARRRFLREAKAAAAVCHDHVVGIHAVEEYDGLPCIVMQYVAGMSLQERLERTGPLEVQEILRIGMQTASGLAAAHAQGLIHRDIKPSNILLENSVERVRITDFGLARAVDDTSLSQKGMVIGTPEYMSPEQARGEPVDHCTDLFSLGSVLFALCTGQAPFMGVNIPAVLKKVCDDEPRAIREVNPDIPDWLVQIIGKLMAKNPAERFPSAAEVADLLAGHLAHLQQPDTAPMPRRLPQTRKRSSLSLWVKRLAAALLLGALGMAAYLFGPTIYRFATDQGQLVIETGDDVQVTVKGDDITILDTRTKKQINLRSGKYRIELGDALQGLQLSTNEFTLERGGTVIVRVRLEPLTAGAAVWEFRHSEPVKAIAFSANGKRLLSGGWDHTARLWDVASGKELHRFNLRKPLENHAVYCVAISSDGRHGLAGTRDGRTWLLDLENGKMLKHCDHPKSAEVDGFGVNSLAFLLGDKQALIGTYDGVVRLWDLEEWKEVGSFRHPFGLWSVDVSPDGRFAVTAGGKTTPTLSWWDLKTLKELPSVWKPERQQHGFWRAVYASDGAMVASASGDKTVRLWNAETGKELRVLAHPEQVECVCYSGDGRRVLSGCDDGIMRLWDAHSGRELCRFVTGQYAIFSVALSRDGRYAASTAGNSIRVWALPNEAGPVARFVGHTGPVWSVSFSPSGRYILSGSEDSSVRVWDIASGKEHERFEGHRGTVYSVLACPNGRWALSGGGTQAAVNQGEWKVCLWEIKGTKQLRQLSGNGAAISSMALTPDGKQALFGSYDGTVLWYDVDNWKELGRLSTVRGLWSVAFSTDGSAVLTGGGDQNQSHVRLWNLKTGAEIRNFKGQEEGTWRAEFTPDGKHVLAAGLDRMIRIWDAKTGEEKGRLRHSEGCTSFVFAPGGKLAVSGGYEFFLRLWDVEKRKELQRFEGHTRGVHSVALSPNGQYVASAGDDHHVCLWRLPVLKKD
ncbi:MAG: protein kinase [Gemmataceae bacterium]|nr:protein kinase [Gemmataceae bacterium]